MQMRVLSVSVRDAYNGVQERVQGVGDRLAVVLGDTRDDSKFSIAVLDGVRAFACLFVIVFHVNRTFGENPFIWNIPSHPLAQSLMTARATGVMLFFVLSGFLLFQPFAKALLFDTSWPSAGIFYLRRILRIVPGYYVSLFILIVLTNPHYLQRDHLKDLFLFLTFFMDSSTKTYQQINGPFWTLGTEWQFYMVLPLLALGMALIVKRVPVQRRLPVLAACLIGLMIYGMVVRLYGFHLQEYPNSLVLVSRSTTDLVMFFLFGVNGKFLEIFAIGMLISLCYVYAKNAPPESSFMQRARNLSLWLWGAGIILLVFTTMWHFNVDHNMYRGFPHGYIGWPFLSFLFPWYDRCYWICVGVGYGACVAAILFGPRELKWPFERRILRWVGLISYSLYIWHLPLLIFLHDHVIPQLHASIRVSYAVYWLWILGVIIPFATLFYIGIERPWMKFGDWLRPRLEKRK